MGSDLMVALGSATVHGQTLFALNVHGAEIPQTIIRVPGRDHAPDEKVRTQLLELPQLRHTCTVLGHQPAGRWGFSHGVNEHQVAVGVSRWTSRFPGTVPGLMGTDLVRLALERSRSARQAMDTITDLLARHGQAPLSEMGGDAIFLLADLQEAYVLETAGTHWAMVECQQVRAVSDVGLIRQDWQRLSPGLADEAIHHQWWPDDGSKLDFAGSLAGNPEAPSLALKRWGRATLLLEQQNGALDAACVRRLLEEHFDAILPPPGTDPASSIALQGSFITQLNPESVPMCWVSLGPTSAPLYFPLCLAGDLPAESSAADQLWGQIHRLEQQLARPTGVHVRTALERLQNHFDNEADQFLAQARQWQDPDRLAREASALMQFHMECFETECRRLLGTRRRPVEAGVR